MVRWPSLRADFVDTFDYFRYRFCHKYRIPGHLPHEFDFALIAKQLPEEDPTQYLARISNYVNNSAPLESFVRFDDQDTAAFQTYYESKIGGEDADAAKAHVKNISIFCGLRWAKRIQTFHIRHIWQNGLLQPYSDIARRLDKDKEIGALVDRVHDEGAAKINRAAFKDHASAMRSFLQSRNYSCLLYTSDAADE